MTTSTDVFELRKYSFVSSEQSSSIQYCALTSFPKSRWNKLVELLIVRIEAGPQFHLQFIRYI